MFRIGRSVSGFAALGVVCSLSMSGCGAHRASPGPAAPAPPAASKPTTLHSSNVAASQAAKRRSVLLDFEHESDQLFAIATPTTAKIASSPGGAGTALKLAPGTRRLEVKLASILSGRAFPGAWTLLRVSLTAATDCAMTLAYVVDGKPQVSAPIMLSAEKPRTVAIDLTTLPAVNDVGSLELIFPSGSPADFCVDDLELIDNADTLVDGRDGGLTLQQKGLTLTASRSASFKLRLPLAESPAGGWNVVEANALRARFHSDRPSESELTLYDDGRMLTSGVFGAISASVRDDPRYRAGHASPAEIYVPEEQGRVDRNTPGDANNDGYNERLGVYCIVAGASRIDVTIRPRDVAVPRPIVQISDLPAGDIRATVEGRLIDRVVRLPDGAVLLALPLRVERATTVSVRTN